KRKSYISYDMYVDNTLNITDKDDALKMGTFKAKHKIYKLIGLLLTRVNCSILSEMGKRAILSLLKALEEHMAARLCFHKFKWLEIVLTRDGWGYIQIYEKVKNKISASEFRNILLKIPYHNNWRAQVQQNLTAIEEQLESADLFLDFLLNGTSLRGQQSLITFPSHFELI
uniref:Uncharacterized protein n=1 Tax=Setaria italica TaxID=4555 RepID=K3ZFL2_SETIT